MQLLHQDLEVSAKELGRAVLWAALLASEHVGELAFEIREKKKLMGLRCVRSLFLVPGGKFGTWPEGSLEGSLSAIARQKASQGKNDVRTIVYEWLGEDSGVPWRLVVEKLQHGMAMRGLLEGTEEKKMKIFSVTRFSIPDSTTALRTDETLKPVQKLVQDCRNLRPDIFDVLEKQVNEAIRARTDQDAGA